MMTAFDFDDEWSSPSEWAVMYRRCGLQVVPAVSPKEDPLNFKRPVLKWAEFEDALVPDATFTRWYGEGGEHHSRTNMGLITGRASSGVFCLDLDTHKEGGSARQWWADLLAENCHGQEPVTPSQRTGGGGRQLLFRAPDGWEPPTFKTPIGIDIRGQGGFMVAPPSRHSSGKVYDWEPGRGPWRLDIVTAPEWLIEAVDHLKADYARNAGSGARRERTHSGASKNAFGFDIDEREQKLADYVWAAVLDLYRESPIPPAQAEQDAEKGRLWQQYLSSTKSRLTDPTATTAELLEREGRGWSELDRKWRRAMLKWDKEVRQAAGEPRPTSPDEQPSSEKGNVNEDDPAAPDADNDDEPFCADTLTGDPPERRWIVPDWVPEGTVTSLYGDGGLGKTLLMQQLACAASMGAPWLGMPLAKIRVLAVLCEDEKDELHRRQNDIKASMGFSIGKPFGGLWLWPRLGRDSTLVRWDKNGAPTLTPFAAKLAERVEKHAPDLLILDTLADFFGGNEIDRVQVNYFVKTVLGGMIEARKRAGAPLSIILLGHPSVAGKASGSGYSGSTAWNAAVRSRMYLTRPEEGGSDERVLTRGKANYAKSGDETAVRLIYIDGVLHAETDAEDGDAMLWAACEQVVALTDKAWRAGQPYSAQKGHRRFVYAALAADLQRAGYAPQVARQAIRECIDDGQITVSSSNGKRGYRGTKNA